MRKIRLVTGLVCLAVLASILTLGLWPFHVPANDVAWLKDRSGLEFGGSGTAISSDVLPKPGRGEEDGGSLEIWLRPGRIWDSGTFLSLWSPEVLFQLSVRQSQRDLEIQCARAAKLYVDDVFRRPRAVFITITSGGGGTSIYVDGVQVKTAPRFRLSTRHFTGRLIAGDAPGQTNSWRGQLFGLAIYHRELKPPEVACHYSAWTQEGRPKTAEDEQNVALYLFGEHDGNLVHNAVAGPDLEIPAKYTVLDKIFLEPFWQEFSLSRSYLSAAVKNIIGFVPLGFCFYAYLAELRVKRAGLATVLLGTAVSVTIEVLQAYLPTRDSGTTDIFTNTLGTWIGVASYNVVSPILARAFPWVPCLTPSCQLECTRQHHGDRD